MQLVNGDGETVSCVAEGKGSVEAIFMPLTNSFNQSVQLLSYNIEAVTDGIDSQARVLVAVENTDTDTIFNSSGIDFDVLKASAICLYPCQYLCAKRKMLVKSATRYPTAICLQIIRRKRL